KEQGREEVIWHDGSAAPGPRLFSANVSRRLARGISGCGKQNGENKPWKSVTQLWVVPASGPANASRQYTRGEEGVSDVRWSPDGKLLSFLMNAGDEKDKKQLVWFMYVDGGEPWQLTKHKSGVRSFEFSPDGKTLLLVATVPETEDQEKRTKNKDDAEVVDHRSEERRVGKECRARLWREQQKKKE